ncbi:hypothetical protein PAXRUDRAFT_828702 [Paxillus rubicundulus Ve08.2h10]|uniref:Uncharacterized protein n=1 Tax=Paxillus rubicundulus Ve08.2h10 TaxID=930991 RepID=A0A0D0E734_9AGAM|nr:hypothetical protein PAXRUDRAFT_828702 [Paxillus rubicundulus Ve08.2h10]
MTVERRGTASQLCHFVTHISCVLRSTLSKRNPLHAGFLVSGFSNPDSLPVLQHRFSNMTYRRVSLSDVLPRHHPSGDIFTLFVLANDLFRGILRSQVDVKISISPVPSNYSPCDMQTRERTTNRIRLFTWE